MVSNRYHLSTIISIFLALGIGIILGGTLGQQWLQDRQHALVDRLEERVTETRKINSALEKRVRDLDRQMLHRHREHERFLKHVLSNQLKDRYVLMIGGKPEEMEPLRKAILWAGGTAVGPLSLRVFPDRYDAVVVMSRAESDPSRQERVLTDLRLAYAGPIVVFQGSKARLSIGKSVSDILSLSGADNRNDPLSLYEMVLTIRKATDNEMRQNPWKPTSL